MPSGKEGDFFAAGVYSYGIRPKQKMMPDAASRQNSPKALGACASLPLLLLFSLYPYSDSDYLIMSTSPAITVPVLTSSSLNPREGLPAPEELLALPELAALARVPEHSVPFMAALSGGTPLILDNFLFFYGEDWLTGVGYPLRGEYDLPSFILAVDRLGDWLTSRRKNRERDAIDLFVVAPFLPPEAVRGLGGEISENDCFYTLPAGAEIPAPLRRVVRVAEHSLRVEEGLAFTAAHRKLWAEMLTKPGMRRNVREMYGKTGILMAKAVPGLSFLNAWDRDGNLAASLLIDSAPQNFCSYIIGAHSRRNYIPHATDLLFAHLLEKARVLGKNFIHLGLGVNEGIRRFKKKWGGQEDLPFVMASWKHSAESASLKDDVGEFLTILTGSGGKLITKQEFMKSLPEQRPFAMLWNFEKNGNPSWIGGTAHFASYSFTRHFEKLFDAVDTVIFEGPMDEESLALFAQSGQTPRPGDPNLLSMLTRKELADLKGVVEGPSNPFMRRLHGIHAPPSVNVEHLLENSRPWYAFFSLWAAFLERQGWKHSVDLEAWNLAHDMGKNVIAMENHEEQLASLGSVPPERVIAFLRQCRRWPAYSRRNMKHYLLGDLAGMYGSSTEFPTRGVHGVFTVRDARFVERMMPFVERGRSFTLVGSAHIPGMRHLLADQGITLRKEHPGLLHKWKCTILEYFREDTLKI